MRIDFPTLGLVVTMVYSINVLLSVLLYLFRPTFKGAPFWIAGQVSVGLGMAGLYLQSELPPSLTRSLDNTVILAGSLFYAHSLWSFRRDRPFPLLLYALLPFITLGFLLLEDFGARTVLFSMLQAAFALFIAWILLHRLPKEYRAANWLTAFPFLVVALASAARVPFNLDAGASSSFASQTGYNAFYLLFSAGIAGVTLFGYYMMTSVRAEKELREGEAQIELRNRALAELNKSKDLFLSILAHDLRSPIGGAARYVRRHLLDPSVDLEEKKDALEVLAKTLERIADLLEKLLLWSRTQREEWKPKPRDLDLALAVREAYSILEPEAAAKAIEVSLPAGAAQVHADLEGVSIILRNLLSNAIKFSHRGGRIRVTLLDGGADPGIEVEDEGGGMEPELKAQLFRIEAKASRQGTEGEPGSGLGLILCRSLAEKNGGRLELESEAGKGTRVSLFLPRPPRRGP